MSVAGVDSVRGWAYVPGEDAIIANGEKWVTALAYETALRRLAELQAEVERLTEAARGDGLGATDG